MNCKKEELKLLLKSKTELQNKFTAVPFFGTAFLSLYI